MKRLNIIGCGKVGKTLGRLWAENQVFEIGDVVNRSNESSIAAVEFLGAGQAASRLGEMKAADVYMIGTPDGCIAETSAQLSAFGLLKSGAVVFHCSGALSSAELASAKKCGAFVASVHPVKSFASAESAALTFAGTFCGVEGDSEALEVLCPAFEAIGATAFPVNPEQKTLYHAGTVIVCNYLAALLEFGVRVYAKCDIPREQALQVMEPIVRETADNVFKSGTVQALTGPIARGDHQTVAKQIEALDAWNPRCGELYKLLGLVALDLSREQGAASAESLAALSALLDEKGGDHA
jgi:predicted short-subunit dehydrogenase-like oxidoreductase (DUF2520 family)